MPPLHDMSPTSRFAERAGDYASHRPTYPRGVIDALLDAARASLGREPRLAADIGAGTGISARLLADAGPRVVAIEPNAAMRAAADPHPRVEWRDATGESTGLESAAIDVILCAQAFHWLRADEAVEEFARVLVPRGVAGLVWNERDESDPFTREYSRLMLEASGDHPAARRMSRPDALASSLAFEGFRERSIAHAQSLGMADLIGRARSASYCPLDGPRWGALREGLERAHASHAAADARVSLRYVATLYAASRRA